MRDALSELRWLNPKNIANSPEQVFYDANAALFNVETSQFNENRSIFAIIKSNAVLRGLLNRKILNDNYNLFSSDKLENKNVVNGFLLQIPYFIHNEKRIYIPTYSQDVNEMYSINPSLLKKEENKKCLSDPNFNIVDPFKTYGLSLLNTPFSRLIKLDVETDDIKAYYHVQFETLYFVNNEVELIEEVPIVDEKIKLKNNLTLFEDLNHVALDFFNHDIKKMFNDLKDFNLLSKGMVEDCLIAERKCQRKRNEI